MVAYAKAATIREKQLEEKKRDWESFKVQEKKKDKLMEIERLKKIKELEEIEERKRQEALQGKEVIIEQIKARELDRLRQREEQEREGQILVQKMKELQREEELQNEVLLELPRKNDRSRRKSTSRSWKQTEMLFLLLSKERPRKLNKMKR